MARKHKRSRRALGSSTAIHTQQAVKAAEDIGYATAILTNKVRNGRCAAATTAYAELWHAIGRFDAHVQAGGRAIKPEAATRAVVEYNARCVAVIPPSEGVGRRRRRSR